MEIQEDVVLDGVQVNLIYQDESINFPLKLLEVQNLSNIVNLKIVQEEFS